jgi:hypothetical protein
MADKLFISGVALLGHCFLYEAGGWNLVGGIILLNIARILNNFIKGKPGQ